METLKFKESEIELVKNLSIQFAETENKDKSLKENLVDFYMRSFQGQVGSKTATKIIEDITSGITTFNEQLTVALKKATEDGEVDYIGALTEAGADKTLAERYELYASFLILLETLESTNLNEDEMNFKESYEDLKKKHFTVPEGEEVTQDMVDEILGKINDCLNNSTLCLATLEASRDLLSTINDGTRTVAVIESTEDDMRAKLILATSTYIAVQKGEVSSLSSDTDPKFVALGVAAGVEKEKVLTEVAQGNIDESKAAKIIKIIGAVALIGALIVAASYLTSVIATGLGVALLSFLGQGILGMIVCSAATVLTVCVLVSFFTIASLKIIEIADNVYDKVVDVFRKNIVPFAKKTWRAAKVWIKSKLSSFFDDDDDDEGSGGSSPTIRDNQKFRIR